MLLFMLLILCSAVAVMPDVGVIPAVGYVSPGVTLGGTAATLVLFWVIGYPIVRGILALVRRGRYRLAGFARLAYLGLVPLSFALVIGRFAWGAYLSNLGVFDVPLLGELVLMLPAVALILLALHPLHVLDRALRGGHWPARAYYAFYARLALAPLPIVVILLSGLRLPGLLDGALPGFARWRFTYPFGDLLVQLVPALVAALLFPFVLRLVFPTSRLDAERRRRLVALARRAGVRVRDVRVWHTSHARIPNAMVVGLVGFTRYVFVTDLLLEGLADDELEAVFAHELGHARYHHLPWFLALVLAYVMFSYGILDPLITHGLLQVGGLTAGDIKSLSAGIALTLTGALIVFLFTAVSRRFERQADLHGTLLAPTPHSFARALIRLERLIGGGARKRPSLTHGSLDTRLRFVELIALEPEVAVAYQRRMRRLFRGFTLALVVALLSTLPALVNQYRLAPSKSALVDASEAFAPDEPWETSEPAALTGLLSRLDELRARAPDDPYVSYWRAMVRERVFRHAASRVVLADLRHAIEHTLFDPGWRLRALEAYDRRAGAAGLGPYVPGDAPWTPTPRSAVPPSAEPLASARPNA